MNIQRSERINKRAFNVWSIQIIGPRPLEGRGRPWSNIVRHYIIAFNLSRQYEAGGECTKGNEIDLTPNLHIILWYKSHLIFLISALMLGQPVLLNMKRGG